MALGLNTTALTSPTSGTNDGGLRQIAGSLGAIADDAIAINQGIQEARRLRGEENARRDFGNGASVSEAGSPVTIEEDNSGGLFGASEAAYQNTLSLLALERAKNDSKIMFEELALQTKGNPTEFQKLADAQIRGYIESAPSTSRRAIEEELKYEMQKGLFDRQKERRAIDIKEANAETKQSVTNIGDDLERLFMSRGSAALEDEDFARMMGDYQALQDIRENNPDIIYTPSERAADDRLLELRLQTAGYSREIKGLYDEVELAADQDRLAGVDESEIVTGKQAAYAQIETILDAMDLSQKERDNLRKAMRTDVNAAAQIDAIEVQKFEEAQREDKARVTADAEVAVSRGQLSQVQINALRPKIGDNNWSRLTKQNDTRLEKQREDIANANLYAAVARGDAPYDPYDRKMTTAMDSHYNTNIAPKIAENPQTAVSETLDYIDRTGHFPKSLQSGIRTAVMMGEATDQIVAVEMAAEVKRTSPAAFDKLPKDVRDIVSRSQDLMNAGIPAEAALLRARAALFPESSVVQARQKALTPSVVKKGAVDTIAMMEEQFGSLANEEMRVMARTLWQDEYVRMGPDLGIEAVNKGAAEALQRMFAPSELGNTGSFMKFAPEKQYGIPGMSDKQNAKWMREQFQAEVHNLTRAELPDLPTEQFLNVETGQSETRQKEIGVKDNPVAASSFLVPDPDAVRDPQGPSYIVMVDPEATGRPYPLMIGDAPYRYRPDYETSPTGLKQAKRARLKAEKELTKARLRRANLATPEEHRAKLQKRGKETYREIHKDIYGFDPEDDTYSRDYSDIP